MFGPFFERFTERLQLEWGITDVQAPVREHTEVVPIERYSRALRMCR